MYDYELDIIALESHGNSLPKALDEIENSKRHHKNQKRVLTTYLGAV